MEELQARHNKEQRDLQSRITQKKKSATKKTRKGVNDECERLQRELHIRQQTEIRAFDGHTNPELDNSSEPDPYLDSPDPSPAPAETNANRNFSPSTPTTPKSAPSMSPKAKKPNRQKARLARRAAENDADTNRAVQEAAGQIDHRGAERERMDNAFARHGLVELEVRPDGHCLYSAVALLLWRAWWAQGATGKGNRTGIKTDCEDLASLTSETAVRKDGYRLVRAHTAAYVLAHPDDFAPFLDEPLPQYAARIKDTTEWGGQIELLAIARAFKVRVYVIKGEGGLETFKPLDMEGGDQGDDGTELWLAYYRHTYGLGEHYNALVRT